MTSVAENKEIVRRVIDHGVNRQDVDFLLSMLKPDYRRHSQATGPMPEIRGRDQMGGFFRENFTTFPDWHEEIVLMLAEDDKVALVTRGTGTQTGPWGEVPPSGKPVAVDNFIVHRLEDGQIAETWIGWDNLAVLGQLGAGRATGLKSNAGFDERRGFPSTRSHRSLIQSSDKRHGRHEVIAVVLRRERRPPRLQGKAPIPQNMLVLSRRMGRAPRGGFESP